MPSDYTRFTLTPRPLANSDAAIAALLDLDIAGWQENGPSLVFWLPAARLDDPDVGAALEDLSRFGSLEAAPESDNWLLCWRALHGAVKEGRITVRPPWIDPEPALGMLDVAIDIGLAFGTGSHATTRECLELLQKIETGSLLDVGTGSGVLAIAAERLGFAPVRGIDNDEVAVSAAWQNGMRNGVEVTFEVADALDPAYEWPAADVVVANLTLGPLVGLGERLPAPGGVAGGAGASGTDPVSPRGSGSVPPRDVIIAGLLDEQAGEAVAAFKPYLEHRRLSRDGWTAVHLRPAGVGPCRSS